MLPCDKTDFVLVCTLVFYSCNRLTGKAVWARASVPAGGLSRDTRKRSYRFGPSRSHSGSPDSSFLSSPSRF